MKEVEEVAMAMAMARRALESVACSGVERAYGAAPGEF